MPDQEMLDQEMLDQEMPKQKMLDQEMLLTQGARGAARCSSSPAV